MDYSIALKTGVKGKVIGAPCFGMMASGEWGGVRDARHPNERVSGEQSDIHSFIEYSIKGNLQHLSIWGDNIGDYDFLEAVNPTDLTSEQRLDRSSKNLTLHLNELFKDLKIYKGTISVHPILKVVRAHIKSNRADKVITGLFLARNLTGVMDMANMYILMLEWGYRPAFAAIVASIINCSRGAFDSSYYMNYVGETNWVSPQSFGKNSLLNMLNGTFSDDQFIQNLWSVQGGYNRDSFFREQRMTFNGRRRNLIDCLSVQNDNHFLSRSIGDRRDPRSSDLEEIDHRELKIPRLVVAMEEFLLQNDVNPFRN